MASTSGCELATALVTQTIAKRPKAKAIKNAERFMVR
jgi:hydroxymethylpyrimidine/phosphomethylpyrimidine kinase